MAQAILLRDVDTLGERGEVVDVSPGYLRNYLVPRKLAQPATDASIAEARRRVEAAERAATEAADRAEETAGLLRKTVLTISHQAGDDGRLLRLRHLPGDRRCRAPGARAEARQATRSAR